METCIKSEPESSVLSAETTGSMVNPSLSPDSPSKQKMLAEAIDVLNANPPGTPNVRLKGFYIYHSYEVIAVTVHFPFLVPVHVCQSIFTNETKVICMYIYRSICIRFANNSQYIYLNILTGNTCMLYELWNFSAVILVLYYTFFRKFYQHIVTKMHLQWEVMEYTQLYFQRKRKAALELPNMLKKIKQKMWSWDPWKFFF